MKSKFILSSAFIMTTMGAFGADAKITEASTCTVDVLGVSDNNAVANTIATWDAIEYTLNPGQYLSVTETSVDKATCPSGSYCVGGTGFTVDNAATSIAQCPTGYENSDAGAGADTQCYTACTVANANIAHATAVSGNDYYGTGTDTCGATACETGYHVDGGVTIVEQTPVIPVNYEMAGNGNYANIDPDGDSNFNGISEDTLTANGTWVSEFDYGRVYGKASCQPRANDATIDYVYSNYMSVLGGVMTIDAFRTGLEPLAGPILTDYAVGVLSGLMDGTKTEKDMYEAIFVVFGTKKDANYQTTDTGEYCYCQMDGFSSITDGVLGEKSIVTSAPWVFLGDNGSAGVCASVCAGNCVGGLNNDGVLTLVFRGAMVGALGYTESGGICAANTINIDWNPDNGGDHIKNMCTYDGSITVPADPVKPGYTFMGWKLLEENK